MKLIDLLNLMVIGEDLPKKIKYEDEEYYLTSNEETYIGCISHRAIGRRHCLEQCLTDEVEIIEEDKKIEKIDVALLGQCDNWLRCPTNKVTLQDVELNPYIIDNIRDNTLNFQRKINELIDEVNKLKGDKNE